MGTRDDIMMYEFMFGNSRDEETIRMLAGDRSRIEPVRINPEGELLSHIVLRDGHMEYISPEEYQKNYGSE